MHTKLKDCIILMVPPKEASKKAQQTQFCSQKTPTPTSAKFVAEIMMQISSIPHQKRRIPASDNFAPVTKMQVC